MFKGLRSIFDRRLQDDDQRDLREIVDLGDKLSTTIQERFERGPAREQALARLMECLTWCQLGLLARKENPRTATPSLPANKL